MLNRKLSRGVSKVQVGAMLAMAVLGVTSLAPRAQAAQIQLNDTNLTLTDPNAWIGGAPGTGDIGVFGSTLLGTTNFSFTWAVGAGAASNWSGIRVLNPAGNILVNDTVNTLTFGTSGIDMSASTVNLEINTNLVLSGSQTWTVAAGRSLTFDRNVTLNSATNSLLTIAGLGSVTLSGLTNTAGTLGLTKVGMGVLTINAVSPFATGGAQTTIGTVTNSAGGGTLRLDFSPASAPAANMLYNLTEFNPSLATLEIDGNAGHAVSQHFFRTTFGWGLTTITSTSSGAGVAMNIGVIAAKTVRNGTSVRIIPNGTLSAYMTDGMPNGQVQATNAAGTNSGAYMTYGLDNYAGINNNVIGAATFGGNLSDTQTWGGGNTTILDIRGNGTMSIPGAFVDAFRFSLAGARTLTISSGSLTTGGLLVAPGVGANDVTILATDPAASLRSGNNGDLVIWQNNTQGNLILNAPLNFAGGTAGQMIKNGAGTLIIATTSNALNASLVINEGTVRAFGGYGVDTASNFVYLEGGTFQAGADMSSGTRPIVLQGPGGGVDVMSGFTMTQNATVSGSGVLFTKTGAGTLSLTYTNNTFTSDMAINGGTILINMTSSAAVPLGTGTVNINNSGKLAIGGGVYNRTNSMFVNAGGVLANSGSISSISVIVVASGGSIAGTGTFSNAIVMPSGSNVEPGARSTIGTLNFQNLTLQSGSLLNMTLQAVPSSSDIINILPGGTLNLAASNINVNLWDISTGDAFFYNGSYQLFSGIDVITSGKYLGGNSTFGALANLVAANLDTSGGAHAGFTITGAGTASSIWVTITGALTVTNWQGPGTNWTDAANWSAGIPGTLAGDAANITGSVTPGIIDLGASSQHLGKLGIDSGTWSANHWTITASTGRLFLDNGSRVASVTVINGANVISAPVTIVSPTTISVNNTAASLTISGLINATNPAATVTIFGAGSSSAGISSPLILTAVNTISTPGLIDATGTLQLGDGATVGYWGSGTLTVSGTLAIKRPAGAFNYSDVAARIIGSGTLTQAGAGSTMTWNNALNTGAFVGTLNVIGGTVKVGAGSVWTVTAVSTGANGTFDLNGTSLTVSGMSNAGVITNSSPTPVSLNINNTLGVTLGGTLTNGPGALSIIKTGGGALTLNGTGSYTGTFFVGAGVVNVNASSALPAGTQLIGNVPGGIVIGNGVNLAADVLLFPSTSTSYAWELPNNGTVSANATFSGTMYESGTGSQFRARVIGGGTATVTGVWTGTADGYVNGSILILSQGNMVFSGPGAQLRAGSIASVSGLIGEQLILGRAEVAGASPNLSVTLTNGAQIINTSDPASMAGSNGGNFLGAAAGSGLTLGATGGTNAVNTLTVDHASIQLGLLNFELDGQATASNLNLIGGTIVAGSYTKTNTAALTTFTINGGILQATQSNAAYIGNAGTTSNLSIVLGTGGAFIDTTATAYSLGISSPFRANTASADGGLTVLGTGSVTLNATGSTYNGATTVNTGTLYAGADNVFSPNSVLKINNTGVVNGGGFAETVAGLDDTATATKGKALNFNTITINAASPNIYTYAGTLTAANLAMVGTGTQILTGAANWTGNTTIGGSGLAGGKLTVGSAGTNGLTFTAGGSLTVGAGESSLDWIKGTAGSAVFTAGSMGLRTVGGVGLLNTPDGATIRIASGSGFIDQGTFINGADYAYIDSGAGGNVRAPVYGSADTGFTGAANILTSGNHVLVTASDTINSAGLSFNTIKISGGSGALNLNGNQIILTNAGILKTGGGTGSIAGGSITMGVFGSTAAAELVVRVDAAGDILNLNAAILDAGGTPLLKSGAGILRLGGANTFSGSTNILNGSLVLTHALALQNSVLVYGQNSGLLSFSGISAATIGGLANTAASFRDILLQNDTGGAVALTINYTNISATETLNNHFTGAGSLIKDGQGRVDLVSSSSFTGGVTVLGGTLSANGASLANNSTVSALGTGPLTLVGGVFRVSVSGDHSVFLANPIVAPAGGNGQFNLGGTTAVTFSGSISGSGTLTRAGGSGVLFLTGTGNSAFHGTFLNGNGSNAVSDVSLATLGALGATDSTWILNSANAMIINASASAAITFNLSGTVSGSSLAINNVNTSSVITTTLTLGSSNLPATFMGNITQGGNGTNSNTMTLIKQGSDLLQLGGTSSNYANLTIAGGTLSFTADAALGAGSTISMFTNTTLQYTGAGGASTKTFNLAGNATLDASGAAAGAVNFSSAASISFSNASTPILITLSGPNAAQNVLAARIGNNGTTGSPGVVSLLKTGAGNWALTGTANTYTGGTTVSSGRLYLANATGNALGTGLVSVNSGGTLGGTGFTTANVTVNAGGALTGGTLATNLGTLNFGGVLTLNAGAILNFDMSLPGQANDLLNFFGSGSVTLPTSGTVAVNLFNANITTAYYYNGTYNLFTNMSAANATYVNTNLAKLTIANENQGGSFVLSVSGTSLRLTVSGAWSTSTWNINGGGSWTTDANWLGSAPNGSGHVATFGTIITANATVAMNGPKTLTSLTFNNTNSYTITGSPSDTLTFVGGTASGALVTVTAGSHTISAPMVVGAPLTISQAASTVLTLGNLSGAGSLALIGSGSLVLAGNAAHTGGTSIATTAQLFVGDGTNGTLGGIIDVQGRLFVNHNDNYTLAASNLVQSSTGGTLTNAGTGTLLLQGLLSSTSSAFVIPGALVVNAGTVMFDTDYTTNGTGSTNLTVNAGGTFDLSGHAEQIRTLTHNAGGTLTNTGASSGTLYLSGTGASTSAGVITGNLKLVKDGAGLLTISGGTVNNTSILIATGQVTFTNVSSSALSGQIIVAHTDNTTAELILGAGVNVSTPVLISSLNFNAHANVEFLATANSAAATFSGNVDIDRASASQSGGDSFQQLRIGNQNASGTLTYAGTITTTFANGAYPQGDSTYMGVSRGNVNLGGNGLINITDPGNPFFIGTGPDLLASTVNFTMLGDSRLLTSMPDDPANPQGSAFDNFTSTALRLGNTGGAVTTSVHTVTGNAFVRVGINGASTYDLQPSGTAGANSTLNLNGGSIQLAHFSVSSAAISGGGSSVVNGPQANVVFNGGTVMAGLANNDMTPGPAAPYNLRMAIGTGGMTLDLNGKPGVAWTRPLASANPGATFTGRDGGLTYVSRSAPGTITLANKHLYAGPTTIGNGATVQVGTAGSYYMGNPVANAPVNFNGGTLALTGNLTLAQANYSTSMLHQYSFNDSNYPLLDTVVSNQFGSFNPYNNGTPNANATVSGGMLSMTGLANSGSSSLLQVSDIGGAFTNYTTNGVSFVLWYTPATQGTNAKLFSIGTNSNLGPQTTANGTSYIMLDAQSGGPVTRGQFSLNGTGSEIAASTASPATGVQHMAVLTIDAGQGDMSLYIDGVLAQTTPLTTVNGGTVLQNLQNGTGIMLGGSQYSAHPSFNGSFNEFRVYNDVLNGAYISQSFAAGPNTVLNNISVYRDLTVTRGSASAINLAGNVLTVGGNISNVGTLSTPGTLTLLGGGSLVLTGSSTASLVAPGGVKLLVGTGGTGGELKGGNVSSADEIVFNNSGTSTLGAAITGGTVTLSGSGTTTLTSPSLPKVNFNNGSMVVAGGVTIAGGLNIGAGAASLGFNVGFNPSVLNITGGYTNSHAGNWTLLAPFLGLGFDVGTYTVITGAGVSLAGQFTAPANANGFNYTLNTATVGTLALIVGIAPGTPTTLYWTGATDTNWANNNWSSISATGALFGSGPLGPTSVKFDNASPAVANLTVAGIVHDLSFTGAGGATIGGANVAASLTVIGAGLTVGPASGAVTINDAGGLNLINNETFTNNGTAGLTIDTAITGQSLTLAGAGVTTLSAPNSFAIGVNITGSVKLGNSGALGSGVPVTLNGTLDLNGIPLSLSDASPLAGSGTITSSAGAIPLTITPTPVFTFTGNIGGGAGSIAVNINPTNAYTFPGNIGGGTGTISLTKGGNGTLVLTGSNSYTGGTTVNTGKLIVGSATALPAATGLTLGATGVLDLNGYNATVSSLTSTAGSIITNNSAGTTATLSYVSTVSAFATPPVLLQDGAGKLALTLSTGAGTLGLLTPNSFSGGVILLDGTLRLATPASGVNNSLGTGPVTLTGGTLQGTSSTAPYTITNDLILNGNASLNTTSGASTFATFSGNISGSGTLTRNGGAGNQWFSGTDNSSFHGTLIWSNAFGNVGNLTFTSLGSLPATDSSFFLNSTNAVTINVSAIALFGFATLSGTFPVSSVNVVASTPVTTTFQLGSSVSSTFLGSITANAANTMTLLKVGTGTLTLGGTNVYGATTISAGALQIGAAGTTGTLGTAAVLDNASLIFNRSNAVTVTNTISGSGSLTQAGTNILTLNATNSYLGGTNFLSGTLALGSTSAIGTAGTLAFNGGVLQFTAINTTDYSARFSTAANQQFKLDTNGQTISVGTGLATDAAGSLTKLGAGSLILTAANAYGATTISAGELRLNGAASLGSGAVANAGVLAFNGTGTTVAGIISGAGTINQLAGTTILTGTNTMSGPVNITGGLLQVGNGGATGSLGTSNVANATGLTLNRTGTLAVSGTISGSGALSKLGAGTATLANYQGTGAVSVNAGTLAFGTTAGARHTSAVLVQSSTVSVAAGTTLDLSNHDMLIHSGSTSALESKIGAAYFFGLWNKPGITSSTAQTNPITSLGIMSGADYNVFSPTPGTFDGVPVANTDTVIKFTYVGDLNLDGLVNDDDLFIFNGAYFFGGTGNYALGDLNFDGLVNDDDLFLFNGNYFFPPSTPLGGLGDTSLASAAAPAGGAAPVPEPASLVLLGMGATGLLLRRRHRTKVARW